MKKTKSILFSMLSLFLISVAFSPSLFAQGINKKYIQLGQETEQPSLQDIPLYYDQIDSKLKMILYDAKGNSGNLNGNPTLVEGREGQGTALQLDGMDDYVTLKPILSTDDNFTIEGWAKLNAYPLRHTPIYIETEANNYTRNYVSIDPSGYIYFDQWPVSGGYLISSNRLEVGKWYHVAVTVKKPERKIFINGMLDKSDSAAETYVGATPTVTYIGFRVAYGYLPLTIDELRIWNTSLSDKEIGQNMNKKLSGNEPGLVGYWD